MAETLTSILGPAYVQSQIRSVANVHDDDGEDDANVGRRKGSWRGKVQGVDGMPVVVVSYFMSSTCTFSLNLGC